MGALFKRLHEPIRRVKLFRDVRLVFARTGVPVDFGKVLLVHQDFRQCVAVEFDGPSAIRTSAHEYVGDQGLRDLVAEGEAGLGVEPAQFLDHVGEVVGFDAAAFEQGSVVVCGEQIQVVE